MKLEVKGDEEIQSAVARELEVEDSDIEELCNGAKTCKCQKDTQNNKS